MEYNEVKEKIMKLRQEMLEVDGPYAYIATLDLNYCLDNLKRWEVEEDDEE